MVEQRGVEPLGSALRTRVSWFHRLLHVPIYWFKFNKAAVRRISPVDWFLLIPIHCPTVASIWRQN